MPVNCPAPGAAIDIGTNTIRLLIGCIKESKLIRLTSSRSVTRLGKDLSKTGRLNPGNIVESVTSLVHFKELCERYGVRDITAVGTSALRDAENSKEFLDRVKQQTGIAVEIISGKREADLTLKGVLGFPGNIDFGAPLFIIDIGGGSTEWIFREGPEPVKMGSVQVGAVRLLERFISHDPPLREELEGLKLFISEELSGSLRDAALNMSSALSTRNALIATGGAATTIGAINLGLAEYDGDRVHMHKISRPSLVSLITHLARMPLSQRAAVKGLEHRRADIIIPGALILKVIMEVLGAQKVIISDYGILEGILLDSRASSC